MKRYSWVFVVLLDTTCEVKSLFFFFNDTATTEIYTLSLHDALPICTPRQPGSGEPGSCQCSGPSGHREDRKSTRLNSSHGYISYAVFCLKKKKKHSRTYRQQTQHPAHPYNQTLTCTQK